MRITRRSPGMRGVEEKVETLALTEQNVALAYGTKSTQGAAHSHESALKPRWVDHGTRVSGFGASHVHGDQTGVVYTTRTLVLRSGGALSLNH